MGLKRNRNDKRTRGMAMVEMVFVLPLLVLLVFAIAQFGLMFSRWLTLSNAVREGARLGVVWRLDCAGASPPVAQQVKDTVVTYARAGGLPLYDTDVTVAGECKTGEKLDVSATYSFQINIPFAQIDSIPISYKSIMRNE